MSNPPEGCDEIREWLGAYALGALEPGEGAPIETHLARCAACRSERDDLADVVRLIHEALPLPTEAHDARPTPWTDRRH
ncbi:hypothetical protein GCM10010095_21280 [Streptomyces anthocyanicus]|uniref:zf-HC2 domain-containing protein n=1 Tax=Streptomyces anthocyanicus TaxID=68174 RepID=UPI00166F7C00|nr:zf-HC2 domain-containing protein [Streptomyces anthocyanicus]GGL35757.1 hypothetical protein GCM10010095_21280 [Streptomyces anthocyanicus]